MGNRNVLIEAGAHEYVGYFGLHGQIDRGYPLEERPEEPLTGAIYEQEYTLLKDAVTEDGEPLERLNGFPLKVGLRKFLRGRVVTDKKEVMILLMPPVLRELISVPGWQLGVECSAHAAVAVKQDDGTEVGIPLNPDDVLPPKGASHYPVGESPEEQRMAEMVMEATLVDDEADELEEILQDAKDGVYGD